MHLSIRELHGDRGIPKQKSSSEQVFLNNSCWIPDSYHREAGRSWCELSENICENVLFCLWYLWIWGGGWASNICRSSLKRFENSQRYPVSGLRKHSGNLAWIIYLENPSPQVDALWVVSLEAPTKEMVSLQVFIGQQRNIGIQKQRRKPWSSTQRSHWEKCLQQWHGFGPEGGVDVLGQNSRQNSC